jgi:FKBP-type peptidyl-prolyl cis-trans isomerase
LADGSIRQRIEDSGELGEDVQARGVPHFFINGLRLTGAQPFEKFRERIDSELEKAKALQATGVKPAKLYEELTKIGKGPPAPERKQAPIPNAGRPSRGPSNAVVVIQEWADFQCPFCSRVQPTLQALLNEFPSQVRLVWRHLPLPFHKDAVLAAEAAEEALLQGGNTAFWKYHDRLFEVQSKPGGLSEPNLVKIAGELGLDTKRFRAALTHHTHHSVLDADSSLAQSLEINGTPSFVINGYFVSGAQPFSSFRRLVRTALEDAKVKPIKSAPTAADADPSGDEIQAPPARATRTASGLAYIVLRKGNGKQHPTATSHVKVHYSGWTVDGKLFDSSVQRGQPSTFGLHQVIRGWTEAVQYMVVGEKSRFWIPPDLAYGDNPRPGAPKGTLVFDIELLAIE